MSGRVQMTLIRIDNYGPWTLKLGSDREYQLQILQSQLYAHLQRLFAERGGAVFYNRFDEMVAISNGVSPKDHQEILNEISCSYPFTISMGVGLAETPHDALKKASWILQESAETRDSRGIIRGEWNGPFEGSIQIAHIDVNDVTKFTNKLSAYDTAFMINKLNLRLSELFLDHEALTFFCGGDNFMTVANGVPETEIKRILAGVGEDFSLTLKAGIGVAKSARKAIELATKGLDLIRNGSVEGPVHRLSDL
ncbi:MAG: GTP cyclohydrolase IIa [Nitrososphaerales archaeon]